MHISMCELNYDLSTLFKKDIFIYVVDIISYI